MNKNAKISNKTLITVVVIIVLLVLVGITAAKKSPLLGPAIQCNDRIDNDGDGRCDYGTGGKRCLDGAIKGDTGCLNKTDNTEASCVLGSTTCGVGACQRSSVCVNDQVSCTPGSPGAEICNSIDDDCDGAVDEDNVCGSPNSCSDTDGGIKPLINGTVTGYLDNTFYSNTDACIDGTNLREYYCSGTYAFNTNLNCLTNTTTVCSNGACV